MSLTIDTELIHFEASNFEEHLDIINNHKIIFSGKFGKGKSVFLNEFFKKQEKYLMSGEIKYNPVFINPIAYSISSNQDILKYIKYDILMELLLNKNVEMEVLDFDTTEVAFNYFKENKRDTIIEVLKELIGYIPKLGKDLKATLSVLKEQFDKLEDYRNKVNLSSEDETIDDFFNSILGSTKSVYEKDVVTKIIEDKLNKISKDNDAKSVLIIDDIDRLDPEHIFRILNVFSSQFSEYTNNYTYNKFSFDKIIIVCDIKNIRSIFHHKYGKETDFDGYINKFYSREIFYYANYEKINAFIKDKLFDLKIKSERNQLNTYGRFTQEIGLMPLVQTLVNYDLLTLRNICNVSDKKFNLYENIRYSINPFPEKYSFFFTEYKILISLFGNYNDLVNSIKRLSILNAPMKNHFTHFRNILFYLTHTIHKFSNEKFSITYQLNDTEVILHLEPAANGITLTSNLPSSSLRGENGVSLQKSQFPQVHHYYEVLIKLIDMIESLK